MNLLPVSHLIIHNNVPSIPPELPVNAADRYLL